MNIKYHKFSKWSDMDITIFNNASRNYVTPMRIATAVTLFTAAMTEVSKGTRLAAVISKPSQAS